MRGLRVLTKLSLELPDLEGSEA
jgi:hypothetical protein